MVHSVDIITSMWMWSVFSALFVSTFVPSQGAPPVTAPEHKLAGNHFPAVKLSKPLQTGASLSSINKERQVYAPDFPHPSEDLIKMALSPVLLPPPPPPAGGDADKYYYPYYFTTKEEADKFYKPDPWEAYYYQLPSLSPGEKIQGPSEQLPQHTGLYDGPINIEENIIPDTDRMFLKNFH